MASAIRTLAVAGAMTMGYAATPASAEPTFHFRGYGTLGIVHSSDDRSDYLVDAFKPNGPGATRSWSADVDSRLGLQVDAAIAPRLSAVVQVITEQRFDDRYEPVVEWANVKYELTPEFNVRAGRIVLPIFMSTDSRRVGYANPWVRPPVEVYSLVPVTHNDGVDATYRVGVGDYSASFHGTYGRSDSKFAGGSSLGPGTAEGRHLTALSATVEKGAASFRASFGRARLTVREFDPLFEGFRQFGPPGAAIADRYDVERRRVSFTGIGATYDPGRWFAMAEWARFDTRSIIGRRSAWYVSAGPRLGKWTPYATYARLRVESETSDPGLPVSALPPALAPAAAARNAGLNAQLAGLATQRTASIGARWDFRRNVALKTQFDRVRRAAGSPGTFGNRQPGFEPGGRADVFSLAVDFVF
jgi:hypothetical protein